MSKPIYIHDKQELENYLLKNLHINYYHIGDLDDFFWPYTSWLASKKDNNIQALTLLYSGVYPVVLLAIENNNPVEMRELVTASLPMLPKNFYCHLSPGLEEIFQETYHLDYHGEYDKMGLTKPENLELFNTEKTESLGIQNLAEIQALYEASYPGNWFDPRMLETGQYVGLRDENNSLISIAGIHVYSPAYKVAALGNITTRPDKRGQGLGTLVTAGLCKILLQTVNAIGLNVKADNQAAIHAYEKIGFEKVAVYHEWTVTTPN